MLGALGMVEWRGIARAIVSADTMVKSSPVELIAAWPVCPGKFIAIIGGEVGAVRNAVQAAVDCDQENVVDSLVLGMVHPAVFPALSGTASVSETGGALGIIETFTSAAAILAGDSAVKGGQVQLLEIRLARGLGGKALVLLRGEISAVQAAVERAAAALEPGLAVGMAVLPNVHRTLWEKLC